MKRTTLLFLGLLAAAAGLRAAQDEPLLKGPDTKALAKLFAEYFGACMDDDIKAKPKSYEALASKLDSLAKANRVETLLVSMTDLRRVFGGAPVREEESPKKGAFYDRSFKARLQFGEKEMSYLLWLPRDYTSSKEPYPVFLSLHPDMERPDEVKNWAKRAYPEALAKVGIVVVPLNLGKDRVEWESKDGRILAFFSLRDVLLKYNVDRLKIFIEGHGATARAVTDYATSFPGLCTAAVFRGLEAVPSADLLVNARPVPFLVLFPPAKEGAEETASLAATFAEEAKSKGVTVNVVEAQPGADGDPGEQGIAALVALVTSAKKTTTPERIQFETRSEEHVNAHWLKLDRMTVSAEDPVRVEAEVVRTKNEIHVKATRNVEKFTVYLNDDLVDMGKTVKVLYSVLGGEEGAAAEQGEPKVCFEGTKKRNLEHALAIWFDNLSGNYGEVYTNFIEVQVPQ
ncbi:MAG: hypothetical protein HY812_06445 [Planctomycetes bacterium]|nr:hypothetical protein [Planctomycetota bacterium]